jgi:Carboxypeptidase regulatory-like domain
LLLGLLLGLLISPWVAQSQAPTATIQGTVFDLTGAVIVGARVTISQPAAGISRTTETDDHGEFHFSGLAIGEYSLRCEQTGFATIVTEPFQISVGQTVTRQIEMKPGEISENLEVTERPEALDATATTTSVALGGERIEEGPASNRNYLNFVLVAPGVAQSNGSNTQRSLVPTTVASTSEDCVGATIAC